MAHVCAYVPDILSGIYSGIASDISAAGSGPVVPTAILSLLFRSGVAWCCQSSSRAGGGGGNNFDATLTHLAGGESCPIHSLKDPKA